MKSIMMTLLIFLFLPSAVNAESVGKGSRLDKRIQTANYSPDNVFRINTMIGRTSVLQLAPGETVNSGDGLIISGDPQAWNVGVNKNGNMIAIKPQSDQEPDTNMIVNTNLNTYLIELKLVNNVSSMTYLLRFNYPKPKKAEEPRGDSPFIQIPCSSGLVNRDYQKRGDMELSPFEAWDNGTFTCLRFPTNSPRPAIYSVLPDGTETLTNWHQELDIVVIHGVSKEFRLRLNKLVLAVKTDHQNNGFYNYDGTTTGEIKEVKNAKSK
jgi:type IV secretion system protein VirB9